MKQVYIIQANIYKISHKNMQTKNIKYSIRKNTSTSYNYIRVNRNKLTHKQIYKLCLHVLIKHFLTVQSKGRLYKFQTSGHNEIFPKLHIKDYQLDL